MTCVLNPCPAGGSNSGLNNSRKELGVILIHGKLCFARQDGSFLAAYIYMHTYTWQILVAYIHRSIRCYLLVIGMGLEWNVTLGWSLCTRNIMLFFPWSGKEKVKKKRFA